MKLTSTFQVTALVATLLFALSAGSAFAKTSYDEIALEYEVKGNKTVVNVEFIEDEEEDDKEVSREFVYFTTDLDEVWDKVADELDITVDDIEDILDGTYSNDEDEGNRDDAEDAIKAAEIALEDAVYEIEDEDNTDAKAKLQAFYDDAEDDLEDAEEAFNLGEYADAEELAKKAETTVNKNILGIDDTDEMEDAEEAIEEAETKLSEAEAYIESLDEDDEKRTELESYLDTAEGYLADAEEAFDDNEYEDAEDWAKKAEDKAKLILEDDSDDDDKGHGNDEDGCDDDNPGNKCDDDSSDDYKDFGKTTDKVELQKQLRMLLMLLIELLQKQV